MSINEFIVYTSPRPAVAWWQRLSLRHPLRKWRRGAARGGVIEGGQIVDAHGLVVGDMEQLERYLAEKWRVNPQ
jgi:hypothetical protein